MPPAAEGTWRRGGACGLLGRRALLLLAGGAFFAACGVPAARSRPVKVCYAASLTALMESHLGPAFARATGYRYAGYAAGSTALAGEIAEGLRTADVFLSASPLADAQLLDPAVAHGHIAWYAEFAHSPLVLGYNPKSRFVAALKAGPWYEAVLQPGFLLGRTDPKLDPKGALVVQLATATGQAVGDPGLATRLLAAAQVFPEEDLVGRLNAGQLDGAFFYQSEAVTVGVPFVAPDAAVDPAAQYTLALPQGGPNPAGALAFSRYLLGPAGLALLRAGGLLVQPAIVHGDAAGVPAALRIALQGG